MKISLNWVSDFVDLTDIPATRVADLLSLHTAEVEGIEVFGQAIADVVVGQVVACGQHPDADKLSVTEVDFGSGENVPVVCGASNVREGLKIAFAPVGSRLPGDLKIKKAKLRGQVSQGMICSERELELSDEHAGILELPEDAPIGTRLVDYLQVTDHVLELDNKSLTHRPDLWGHYGFARELAALLDRPLKPLPIEVEWPAEASPWTIERKDAEGCAQYGAVEIDLGGKPGEASELIRRRLTAVGQRTVNDIVDLSNYVMLETGQPTHAFDAATLDGQRIVVRDAEAGETLVTLDEQERALTPGDLVIADGSRGVALAGVMGGLATEVTDSTSRILLESAAFHPTRVRRTAHRLALRSEASSRFEKTLDPAYASEATARFCHLLLQMRPEAKVLTAPVVAGAPEDPAITLPLDLEQCSVLLGIALEAQEVERLLTTMGFTLDGEGGRYQVRVPSWRATKDVTLPIDLVEEVGRMHGYDRIEAAPLEAPIAVPVQQPQRLLARRLTGRLVEAFGSHETQAYSFLDRAWADRLGLPIDAFARLGNPVLADQDLMRRDPVPSLLDQAAQNLHEVGIGSLCEIAKGYEPQPSGEAKERRWLGAVVWGPQEAPKEGQASLFGQARSMVEDMVRMIGLVPGAVQATPPQEGQDLPAWAHPVHALCWSYGEQVLGWSCRAQPTVLKELDFEGSDAAIVLLDLEVLSGLQEQAEFRFQAPARFPGIKVDVALALPASKGYAEVETSLRKAGGKLLDSLELFDIYTGPGLEDGQRSLAFRCVLRAADRTLSDKEEQKFLRKVEHMASELGGNLRS